MLIRPTARAVLIFVAGIPLALFVVIYDPSLWVLSFNYGLLVLLVAGTDALPNVRGVQSAALQFYTQEAIYGIKTQQQSGEGAEFEALREYAPGLDSRHIDWKHSAKHRKLLCKEFRTERNHQIVMAFDTGYLMVEPVDGLTRLDHAINAGLLLAWISLQGGDLVGLLSFDEMLRQ